MLACSVDAQSYDAVLHDVGLLFAEENHELLELLAVDQRHIALISSKVLREFHELLKGHFRGLLLQKQLQIGGQCCLFGMFIGSHSSEVGVLEQVSEGQSRTVGSIQALQKQSLNILRQLSSFEHFRKVLAFLKLVQLPSEEHSVEQKSQFPHVVARNFLLQLRLEERHESFVLRLRRFKVREPDMEGVVYEQVREADILVHDPTNEMDVQKCLQQKIHNAPTCALRKRPTF